MKSAAFALIALLLMFTAHAIEAKPVKAYAKHKAKMVRVVHLAPKVYLPNSGCKKVIRKSASHKLYNQKKQFECARMLRLKGIY